MVLSSRSPNPLYPQSFEIKPPQLGIRDLIVLTLGATSSPMVREDFFILTKSLASRLDFRERIHSNLFQDMIKKLKMDGIVRHVFNDERYQLVLSPKGLGELDAILFSKDHVLPQWNSFREFANLAAS